MHKIMIALAATLLLAGPAVAQTRSDPPGTAAERTIDRTFKSNESGAFPAQRDGTAVNPSGVAPQRAFDRAAGTNSSGAYPAQSDGRPGNPPGTAVGREIDRQTR